MVDEPAPAELLPHAAAIATTAAEDRVIAKNFRIIVVPHFDGERCETRPVRSPDRRRRLPRARCVPTPGSVSVPRTRETRRTPRPAGPDRPTGRWRTRPAPVP